MDDDELTKTVEIGTAQRLAQSNIPPQPEFIGPYKIQSLLKQGGMSLIYLALQPNTSKTVVVKVVLPKYLKTKDVLIRLLREAKILSVTDHPNIVKLYDVGRSDEGLFIVMEFVQGLSLRKFIKTSTFTHKQAIEIVLQIAYALAHLHSQGIIHRDLKPDNILMSESGGIKLIDFGISQFVETEDIDHKSQRKARMGTPLYMSPEQKETPEKVSYATDIFSLGIIAYELYLGRLSHGIIQISFLPRELQKILGKAMDLDPAKRYSDIVDMIADLSHFLKHMDEEETQSPSEDIYQLIEETTNTLLSTTAPHWPDLEMGIAAKETALDGSYLDFFPLTPNRYGLILANPKTGGPKTIFLSSMLRGMLHMALTIPEQLFPMPRFLEMLNRTLCKEKQKGYFFDFSCLFLDLEHNLFAFASSQPNTLCHFPSAASARFLNTENPPLGKKEEASFLEVKENWNMEDVLILSSSNMDPEKLPTLSGHIILEPKVLAEKTLETVATKNKAQALIAIKRL